MTKEDRRDKEFSAKRHRLKIKEKRPAFSRSFPVYLRPSALVWRHRELSTAPVARESGEQG